MNTKILFIYPTPFRVTGLSVGVASLCGMLKANNYEVKVLDTAFYPELEKECQIDVRAERMIGKRISQENYYWKRNTLDMEEDFINIIRDFKPDIIGFSILEPMFDLSLRISKFIKREFKDTPIIAGGVFPSLSPEFLIHEDTFDIICIGD